MIKVKVLNFFPDCIPGNWNNPYALIDKYISDIYILSQGNVNYSIQDIVVVRDFPILDFDLQYTCRKYETVLHYHDTVFRHENGNLPIIDYKKLLDHFCIFTGIRNNLYDEVWLFGGPYFGFYESRMVGYSAYWCNSPPIKFNSRNFIVMGFNYERGVREMLHSFGHRCESILNHCCPKEFEKWSEQHGTVHCAPWSNNEYSQDEYEWLASLKLKWWELVTNLNENKKCWLFSLLERIK